MRSSGVKRALAQGEKLICIGPGFPSPDLVEFLGHLKFDCIFIDAEHGVIGVDRAQEMVRAADAAGVDTVTRVPSSDPAVILGYLESGTGGVIVPHVNSAEQARAVVQAVKYSPIGARGGHSATRAANYGITQGSEAYFAGANEQTLVGLMIEETSALENLDEIVAVDHIDLCFIGPGDLSLSMGYPGQPNHPDVQAEVEKALQTIRKAGIAAGTVTADGPGVKQLFDRGFQFALVSASRFLVSGAQAMLAAVHGE